GLLLGAGGSGVGGWIAAALAAGVVAGPLPGPGAGGFLLAHSGGRTGVLDCFVAVPGRAAAPMDEAVVDFEGGATQVFHVGEASVAVPGAVQGLEVAHRRWATMPWAELGRPAIELARSGFEMTPAQAFLHRILDPILRGTRD